MDIRTRSNYSVYQLCDELRYQRRAQNVKYDIRCNYCHIAFDMNNDNEDIVKVFSYLKYEGFDLVFSRNVPHLSTFYLFEWRYSKQYDMLDQLDALALTPKGI